MEMKHYATPKRINHHAMPIVIIALTIVIASVAFVSKQSGISGSSAGLAHDLFSRTLNVSPTPRGFVHVSLNKTSNKHIGPEIDQAGRTVELMFTLSKYHS